MNGKPPTSTTVLCWPKRLLSADDLRRHLTSQRELVLLPNAILTPLAADELQAKRVRISWQMPAKESASVKKTEWIYAGTTDAVVVQALAALEREGSILTNMDTSPRRLAEAVMKNGSGGGVYFHADVAAACCAANKISGIRAAAVLNTLQVAKAKKSLGANLFAIEMPGRTFFELRQMLKAIVSAAPHCPDEIARVLQELDGHAHR
jgi:hypothetical protein